MRSATGDNGTLGGRWRAARGSVTAEFATVIPAVLLVLVASLASLQVAGDQIRLQDAAASSARSLSRGDGAGTASSRLAALVAGAQLDVSHRGDLVCVLASAPSSAGGGLLGITLRASSCALDGGR